MTKSAINIFRERVFKGLCLWFVVTGYWLMVRGFGFEFRVFVSHTNVLNYSHTFYSFISAIFFVASSCIAAAACSGVIAPPRTA